MLIFDNIARWRHHLKSLVRVMLPKFRCFIFHPILRFRPLFHFSPNHLRPLFHFSPNRSFSRPLFHFSPKIWRRRDSNLRPPDLIHDELDHRTTVSCAIRHVYIFLQNKQVFQWKGFFNFFYLNSWDLTFSENAFFCLFN